LVNLPPGNDSYEALSAVNINEPLTKLFSKPSNPLINVDNFSEYFLVSTNSFVFVSKVTTFVLSLIMADI